MPYNLRYYLNFKDNASGLPVVVNIYFPNYDDVPLELIPADIPCIVSESNSDENIFNPIRSKEFRIKFVTDNLVFPGIEDFATNNDNDWKVDILVNGAIWLTGFLLTDQMTEGWYTDTTKHYIELVSTDNLGTLKKLALLNQAGEKYIPSTKQFLIDIVRGALEQAIAGLVLNIFDNLFEVSFTDRNDTVVNNYTTTLTATAPNQFIYLVQGSLIHAGDTLVISGSVSNNGTFTVSEIDRSQHFAHMIVAETVVSEANTANVNMEVTHVATEADSYQQTMVDMRTFTTDYDTYEDAYTVLTKILQSRNSVLFQHMGEWYIVRISELFRLDLIDGSRYYPGGAVDAIDNASWTADVNEHGDIIPVEQFMIKSFLNPVLSNKVIYNYRNFDEFVCNELWKRGTIVIDTDALKEFDVDCWTHLQGAFSGSTASTVLFRRRQTIDVATGTTSEDYIYIEHEPGPPGGGFIKSEPVQVNSDDKITISFSRRLKNNYTGPGTEVLALAFLYGNDSTYYTLDDDGTWYESNASFTLNVKNLSQGFSSGDDRSKWLEKTVESDFLPKTGLLVIYLFEGSLDLFTGQESQFKDLKISYASYLTGRRFVNVEGDYHTLTLATQLKDTAEYEVFLSDSPKYLFKGALFQADGQTLTELWYELSYPDTIYPIKRFNAIDHYKMSNRNMLKAEGSFYKWLKGEPVNSVHKITINNGNANKRFIPAYIRDLNTSNSRFSSLFIEVFDELKEGAPFVFNLIGEFRAPDAFDYLVGFDGTEYFNVGDQVSISDTANNNISVTVVSKTVVGAVYTIIFSGPAITDEFLAAPATFTTGNPNTVNAVHEFNYIFKSR